MTCGCGVPHRRNGAGRGAPARNAAPRRGPGAILSAAALALTLLFAAPSVLRAEPVAIEVTSRPITQFRIGRDETRFGVLRFLGGMEMVGRSPFGAFSAIRFLDGGTRFLGVADTGHWYSGEIVRDEDGTPRGMRRFMMAPVVDGSGRVMDSKWDTDAEGLAIDGDVAVAGFERAHRITQYRLDPPAMGPPLRDLDFLVPAYELRRNRGFETLVATPDDGPYGGALIAIAEKSIDRAGNVFGAVLSGPRKGIFTVARSGEFDITDGTLLPDGSLLLLERKFAMSTGVAMRLRRVAAGAFKPGAVIDGPVLLEADMAYQIDNMEGIDAWQRADGTTVISIVSDDNRSFLQRNLYLEFELID